MLCCMNFPNIFAFVNSSYLFYTKIMATFYKLSTRFTSNASIKYHKVLSDQFIII